MKNTTLVYIEDENRYLMLYRNKKKEDPNAGKWIGIGGKFKEGESPEDCMLREVFEETGLTLTSYRFRGIVTFVSDVYETEYMHLFTADAFSGSIKECDEGDLAWVEKDKIFDLPLWEGDKEFLKLLSDDENFFTLKLVYKGGELTLAVRG